MKLFRIASLRRFYCSATFVLAAAIILSLAAVTGCPAVLEYIKRYRLQKEKENPLSAEDHLDSSSLYVIPNNVFYIWCGTKRYFEFRHYLSVFSVFRFVKPDRVVFYYEHKPVLDYERYNTWFWELKDQFTFFNLKRVPKHWCENKLEAIDQQLLQNGGIYIQEDVVLAFFDQQLRFFDHVIVKDKYNKHLMRMSRRHCGTKFDAMSAYGHTIPIYLIEGRPNITNNRVERGTIEVITTNRTNKLLSDRHNQRTLAIVSKFPVFPATLWDLESRTGQLFRDLMYQKSEAVRPLPHYDRLAPNVAHIVWIHNNSMSFQFFLCVLSLVEVANMDRVYIHGDGPPT